MDLILTDSIYQCYSRCMHKFHGEIQNKEMTWDEEFVSECQGAPEAARPGCGALQ